MIDRILIPSRYTFFRSLPAKNSEVKRTWSGAILGWVTDQEVCISKDKSVQKRLICEASI
jgi:hypothetical protein